MQNSDNYEEIEVEEITIKRTIVRISKLKFKNFSDSVTHVKKDFVKNGNVSGAKSTEHKVLINGFELSDFEPKTGK